MKTLYLSVKLKFKNTGMAIIYSLLIPQAIVQLILFIFFRNEDESTRIDYIFNSFIFSLIGLVLGILIYVGGEFDNREGECYFAGQLFAFLILLALYLDRDSPEKIRAKRFENASNSYNHIFTNDEPLDLYMKPTQLALAKLESEFDDPNSFLLKTYSTSHRDTLISGDIFRIYTVYLIYDIMEKDSLFSRISVFRDTANIEKFNADYRNNKEVQSIKWVPENYESLPDSTGKNIE